MFVWLFLLIPIIAAGIAKSKYERELVWWELALPVVVGMISIFLGKACTEYYATATTEYWGGYLVNAGYYEPWDEEVSCRHPQYCTRSTKRGTETYQCGWQHLYDVDYHPEYWELADSNGKTWHTTKDIFDHYCFMWRSRFFVNMHRRYHSIDGNKYQTDWSNVNNKIQYETLQPTVVEHTYENRVIASHSVLNYRDISDEEKNRYHLFEYPRTDYFCPSVLGYQHTGNIDIDKTNALIGGSKQIRIWILCFKNQPLEAAFSQEAYWKKGNKNELVICTSLDNSNKIQWGHVFSWTDKEEFKIHVRQWLEDRKGSIFDVKEFNNYLKPQIEKEWERKQFAEFKFIEIEPPFWAYFVILLSVVATTVGTLYWGVVNEERV